MFGSLMMFASGVLASSPSSASASGTPLVLVEALGELGEDPAGERDVAGLDLDAGGAARRPRTIGSSEWVASAGASSVSV